MAGITRWDVEGEQRPRPRRAVCDADEGRLGRGRRPDRGGRVRPAARPRLDRHHRHRPARPLAPAPAGDGGTDVTLRLSYHAEGGLLGVITDRVAAPIVGGNLKRSLAELKRTLERQGASHRLALGSSPQPPVCEACGHALGHRSPRRRGDRAHRDAADHPAHGGEPDRGPPHEGRRHRRGQHRGGARGAPAVRRRGQARGEGQGGRHPDR